MEENSIIIGLKKLSELSSQSNSNLFEKMQIMHSVYLGRHSNIYTDNYLIQINYYLKSTLYKFHLTSMSLEELWSLSELKRGELFDAIENSVNILDITDIELKIISFVFEGFLFQARSFLDFVMIYLCLLLKINHQGKISKKKFFNSLEMQKDKILHSKAINVSNYFMNHVFGDNNFHGLFPNNWGTLLTDLRDKIVHRDKIRPSFKSTEKLSNNILFNWPTIQDLTYDRFQKYIQNGMFSLFVEVMPIIFDLKWIAGKVDHNSWD
ncbi:MAG: hypothetical protein JXR46_04070 [Calditrichaceae bacterium]|nr:hypothetical protein [Calditrichaceae bacterium]MBN2708203.1 hypothetical protein [Calditrichaceae bacterium]RQV97395.1 MAG: hypothetical protein EH224_01600 [Calditrichota bacterium]